MENPTIWRGAMSNTSRKNEEQLTLWGLVWETWRWELGWRSKLEEGMNNICQDSPIFAFAVLTSSCGIELNRITEWFGFEWTFIAHLVQAPYHGQGQISLGQKISIHVSKHTEVLSRYQNCHTTFLFFIKNRFHVLHLKMWKVERSSTQKTPWLIPELRTLVQS